jgi:hypothetical protein
VIFDVIGCLALATPDVLRGEACAWFGQQKSPLIGKNGEHMGRYDLTKMIWDIVLSGSNGLNMYTFLRCMKTMFQSL